MICFNGLCGCGVCIEKISTFHFAFDFEFHLSNVNESFSFVSNLLSNFKSSNNFYLKPGLQKSNTHSFTFESEVIWMQLDEFC